MMRAKSNSVLCNEDTAKDRRKGDIIEELCRFSIKAIYTHSETDSLKKMPPEMWLLYSWHLLVHRTLLDSVIKVHVTKNWPRKVKHAKYFLPMVSEHNPPENVRICLYQVLHEENTISVCCNLCVSSLPM